MSIPPESLDLDSSALLRGLSPDDRRSLANIVELRRFAPGETIVAEGSAPPVLYVLREGRAEVRRRGADGVSSFVVATLGAGESVGELRLVQPDAAASATVVAATSVSAWVIEIEPLLGDPDDLSVRATLFRNLAGVLVERLKRSTAVALESMQAEAAAARERAAAGHSLVTQFTFIGGYILFVSLVQSLRPVDRPEQSWLSASGIVVSALASAVLVRGSGLPPSAFGLTLDGWRRHATEGVLFSLPIMALILGLKGWLLRGAAGVPGARLFHWDAVLGDRPFSAGFYLASLVAYLTLSPVQELFCRSGLQGSLHIFRPGRGTIDWSAILVSNLLFAAMHTHIGFWFAVAAFVPGLFWGWLFSRQRSLVGAAVSHTLIGVWALYIVGVQDVVGGR